MKPKEILTPRLRLGAMRPEDREPLLALFCDGEVSKTYMVPELPTEEAKTALFERLRGLSLSEQRFLYGIFRGEDLIGLLHEVDRQGDAVELGYLISPREKGRGYASEALSAVIPVLFDLGFSSVRAAAFVENAASQRVMEKCGMRRTGETETVEYRGETKRCICWAIRQP